MPFPNEHAARQVAPTGFARFRRDNSPRGVPAGISFIFGVRRDNTSVIQSIRFDKDRWTPSETRTWLTEHDFKTGDFEEATGEERGDSIPHIDRGQLGKPTRTSQGFLRADAFLTRTGVFRYGQPDGSVRRELRLPEEVFDHDSLSTLSLAPVTDSHPPRMLNADNAREFQVGVIGENAHEDEERVRATLMITVAPTIQRVEKGKRQVSAGYHCGLEFTPGTYKGEKYDAIQRRIRYNHVAVVDAGRAGPSIGLRMDDASDLHVMLDGNDASGEDDPQNEPTPPEGKPMKTITIDGVDFEVSEQVAQAFANQGGKQATALQDATTRADAAEEKVAAAAKASEAVEKKAKEEAAATAKAKEDAEDPAVELSKAVAARRALERDAEIVLGRVDEIDVGGEKVKIATMDDDALMRATIDKADSEIQGLAEMSGDLLRGRFDGAVAAARKDAGRNDGLGQLRVAGNNAGAGDRTDAKTMRDAMIERSHNAWKPKEQSA